jgi:hypothetical protein
MEGLIKKIEDSDTIPVKVKTALIHVLLYADDIIIFAYSSNELQKKINILQQYFEEHGLRINLTKTKFMIFAKKRTQHKFRLYWGEKEIERVESYTYLGVPFTETHNFLEAKNHFIQKTKIAMAQTHALIWRSKMRSFSSMMAVYKSLVRSVLMYCCPIWGMSYMDCIEVIQAAFLKKLFMLPKMTPQWFVRLETNTTRMEMFFLRSTLFFWLRILNKPKDSLVYNCYMGLKESAGEEKNNCIISLRVCYQNIIALIC